MSHKYLILLLLLFSACSSLRSAEPTLDLKKEIPKDSIEMKSEEISPIQIEETLNEELSEQDPTEEIADQNIEKNPTKESKLKSTTKDFSLKKVTFSWKAPKEKLLRYYLEYGYSKNKLDKKKTIEINELQKITHPIHGSIYIYSLKETKREIFYRLQSENEIGLSKKSIILKIP